MKKLFIFTIFTSLLLTASTVSAAFTDVDESDEWHKSVHYLQAQNVVSGYPDGSFLPWSDINRAEFLKIVIASKHNIQSSDGYKCFNDVQGNEWFAAYICKAKDLGIVDGRPDGGFYPGDLVTQAEALKIIFNTFEEELPVTGGAWYEPFLKHAENLGMYYFEPDDGAAWNIYRNQASYFIAWMMTNGEIDQITPTYFYLFDEYGYNTKTYNIFDLDLCLPWEHYKADEYYCYATCEDKGSCQALKAEILKTSDDIFAGVYDEIDFSGHEEHNAVDFTGLSEEEGMELVLYKVTGDSISQLSKKQNVDTELQKVQNATARHQEIWDLFTKLIPQEYREDLTRFEIFTDGSGGIMGYMGRVGNDWDQFTLKFDPEDSFFSNGAIRKTSVTYVLIHEFAHKLTLNTSEIKIPPYEYTPAELKAAEAACAPNLHLDEGCAFKDSYINDFYLQFWADKHAESVKIEAITDPIAKEDAQEDFYNKYPDTFVTRYASTNIVEDIADSFSDFVVKDKPTGNKVVDQKVKFFYNYPELVTMRNKIRANL